MIGAIIKLFLFLTALTLFLGIEMSSPYTRASPDCSVWCVLGEKITGWIGADDDPGQPQ